jgi:hypothetical protein
MDPIEDFSETESPRMEEVQVLEIHHRIHYPDVPEDVEDDHFNDPNWDYRANSSLSPDDSPTYCSTDMGTTTGVDTYPDRPPIRKRGSKADDSHEGIHFQWVFLLRCPYCNFSSIVLYQRITVPRSPGSCPDHR